MKTVEINKQWFEIHTSRMHPVAPITGCNIYAIYDAYHNPSENKVKIWNYWCTWCNEINNLPNVKCGIQIASHNCFSFNISGSLRTNNGVYDLKITKYHNYLYKHWEL